MNRVKKLHVGNRLLKIVETYYEKLYERKVKNNIIVTNDKNKKILNVNSEKLSIINEDDIKKTKKYKNWRITCK